MGTTEDRHTIHITGIECISGKKPRWAQSALIDEIVFGLPLLQRRQPTRRRALVENRLVRLTAVTNHLRRQIL